MSLYWKRGEVARILHFQLGNAAGVYQDMTGGSGTLYVRVRGSSTVAASKALTVPDTVTYPAASGWVALTLDATLAGLAAGEYDGQVDAILAGGAKEKFPNDRQDTVNIAESVSAYP